MINYYKFSTIVILLAIIVFVIVFVFFAQFASAALVPCGPGIADNPTCDVCDFFTLIDKIINFVMIDIAPALALLLIIVGAIVIITSGGSQTNYDKGKGIIFAAIIGFLIILGSWFIINLVMSFSTGADSWNTINCAAPGKK